MTQINIIQSICDILTDNYNIDEIPYKKEMEELDKWRDILFKYMEGDKKFNSIFFQYDMAEGLYEGAVSDYYFREGFLHGARLMLEICGKDNKNG